MAKPAPVENCYDDPEPILAAKTRASAGRSRSTARNRDDIGKFRILPRKTLGQVLDDRVGVF